MSLNQYDHWEGDSDKGTVVLQEDLNEVHIPKRLKGAMSNHRYRRAIDPKNGQVVMAYVRQEYEHEEYPKLLYHPKYGQSPEPKLADYAAGCTTPEQSIKAHEAYNAAMAKWNKTNRTKEAKDKAQEDYFVKKGWLTAMPKPKVIEGSPESDEI